MDTNTTREAASAEFQAATLEGQGENRVAKAFLFTIWDCDPEQWELPFGTVTNIRRAVWQFEYGEESQKPHIQCYIETKKSDRYTNLAKKLGLKDYWAKVINGPVDRKRAYQYCFKEDTRIKGPWYYMQDFDIGSVVEARRYGASLITKESN